MNLSHEDQKYAQQEGLAGVLYDCEPRGFAGTVTDEEMNALSKYYFAGREIDVENMFEYRKEIERTNPKTVALAKAALRKVAIAYRVDSDEIKNMFS